jgi:hypothetical protein
MTPEEQKELHKEAIKEAIAEWLDKQFIVLGKWTLKGIGQPTIIEQGKEDSGATFGSVVGRGNIATVQQTVTTLPLNFTNGGNGFTDGLVCTIAIFR